MKKILISPTLLFLVFANLNAQIVVGSGLAEPTSFAFHGNDLYFIQFFEDKISKIDITEPNPTVIDVLTNLETPKELAFNGNDLYFIEASFSTGNISKFDVTDTTPIVSRVASSVNPQGGLAFHGNDLYVSSFNFSSTPQKGAILKIDITTIPPTVTTVFEDRFFHPRTLAFIGNDLYFSATSGSEGIFKIDITEPNPMSQTVMYPGEGVSDEASEEARQLAVKGNTLYFSNYEMNSIYKVGTNLHFNPITPVLSNSISNPYALAFNGNDLYISEFEAGNILKYTVDSTLSIDEISTPEVTIAPNPTNDFIQISGLNKCFNYSITNALGAILKKGSISDDEPIDMRDFANGLYFLKLDNNSAIKIIKN